jgi:predicted XRE-type DNA-binding protein
MILPMVFASIGGKIIRRSKAMANVDDVPEEILDWAEESDQRLLENLGRSLADDEPLGFSGGGFSDLSSSASNASLWLDKNTQSITEVFDTNKEIDDVKLAGDLASVLYSNFPELPLGPLALLVARRIIKRRSSPSEASEIEGVTKERSHRVSEEGKLDKAALVPIFEGELNREALAETLRLVMEQRGLSVRRAAALADVQAKEIQRISSGDATIDKGLKVLSELGVTVHFKAEPTEPS